MTIQEALISINLYPIPVNAIDKIIIDRGLDGTADYDSTISGTEIYELATADVYLWLYTSQSVKEQQISFTIDERDNFLYMANLIYSKYDDPKFTGTSYGYIGENFND